jgi:hypothetical protein
VFERSYSRVFEPKGVINSKRSGLQVAQSGDIGSGFILY